MSSNQLENNVIKYTGNDAKITLSAEKMSSLFLYMPLLQQRLQKEIQFPSGVPGSDAHSVARSPQGVKTIKRRRCHRRATTKISFDAQSFQSL